MDDVLEIDFRKIIKDLLVNWKWIVGFTLVVGIAAFLFSFLQPRTYSASALIAITKPRYLPNFDAQYQTVNNTPPTSSAIIGLATGDEIVQGLYEQWHGPDKEKTTPRDFRDKYLKASVGEDPTIIVLRVTAYTAEDAADLANAWARATASRANQLFSGTGGNQVEDFKAQVDAVEKNLSTAEAALADFENRDQISILNNQLASMLAQQADSLRKQRLIETTISDAQGLLAQMQDQSDGSAVPSSLQTNLLVLQMRIYNDPNLVSSTNTSNANSLASASALQIQIPNQSSGIPITLPDQSSIQTITKAVFSTRLQSWTSSLEAQSADLQAVVSQLTNQITALQKQIQDLTNEKERLTHELTNSQAIYSTLLIKYEEVKITSSDVYGNAQVASTASAPVKANSSNAVRNTVLSGFIGFVLMIGYLVLMRWWNTKN